MTSRRTVLGAGAVIAVGTVVATGRGDDVLRALGVKPVPEVRDSDRQLLAAANDDLRDLLAIARGRGDERAVSLLESQLIALSSAAPEISSVDAPRSADRWLADLRQAAAAQRKAVPRAVSDELALVLASLAAGLEQLATFEEMSR